MCYTFLVALLDATTSWFQNAVCLLARLWTWDQSLNLIILGFALVSNEESSFLLHRTVVRIKRVSSHENT